MNDFTTSDAFQLVVALEFVVLVLARLRPSKLCDVVVSFRAMLSDTLPFANFTVRDILVFTAVVAGGSSGYRLFAQQLPIANQMLSWRLPLACRLEHSSDTLLAGA